MTTANVLIAFNSSAPGSAFGSLPITGLQSGENVLGIDFRPLTRQLYALGSTSRVYTINLTTGAATVVGGQFRTITLASPLANGAGINVNFTLLIFQAGTFRFFVNVEALP